jgi:hypothetical protein
MKHKHIMAKKVLCFAFCSLFFVSCSQHQEADKEQSILFEFANRSEIRFSDIANDIHYVKLEFTDECPIRNIKKIRYVDKKFYLLDDYLTVYVFDESGRFIRMVGSIGQGPGEYLGARDFDVFSTSCYIFPNNNGNCLLEYDLAGIFQRYIKTEFDIFGLMQEIHCIDDTLIAMDYLPVWRSKSPNYNAYERAIEYQKTAILNTKTGNVEVLQNSLIFPEEIHPLYGLWGGCNIYWRLQDTLSYFQGMGERIERFEQSKLMPRYFIDFGDYKTSMERLFDRRSYDLNETCYILDVKETSSHVFFHCWFERKTQLAQYDKKTSIFTVNFTPKEKGYYTLPHEPELFLGAASFLNDFDGGPSFYPKHAVSDSMWVHAYSAYELVDFYQNHPKPTLDCKYPDKAKELSVLLENLKKDDNPVLFILSLK